jgi:excisionase family DNA binding protein
MENLRPRLVSIKDACLLLGIGQTKVYELIAEGLLQTVTIGSRRLITLASIDALIEGAAANAA